METNRNVGADGADLDGLVASGALNAELTASWQRSMKLGLRRQDRALFCNPVTSAVSRRVVDENRRLLTHASPEMARLYTGLGSARWVALCINAAGQVVCSVGDNLSAPREIRALMHPGRLLAETELGTTAPGCALEAGRSVVVTRGEHYLLELSSFFCASAPIFGPDGILAGALDITGVEVESVPLANDMVGVAARAIENSMLSEIGSSTLIRFHCDERLVGTPFEGVLALNAEGIVNGANRTARQLLSLPMIGTIDGTVQSLFDGPLEDMVAEARRHGDTTARLRTHDGAFAHARIEMTRREASRRRTGASDGRARQNAAADRPFVLEDAALRLGLDRAARLLAGGLPILLQGETGTGKELFARALHHAARPGGPFVALNCAAIPEGLIEAELFGYADGAFTGGRKGGSQGKIEQANGGVLFLDEIGDMPLALQSRLLRVVQERRVARIGDNREAAVDVLIVSATHRQLQELVDRREFREDLFYRLNGHTLTLPPLRERKDLAAVIRELFLFHDARQADGIRCLNLDDIVTPRVIERLSDFRWPGNIRQLDQVILGLVALRSASAAIDVHDLPDWISGVQATSVPRAGKRLQSVVETAKQDLVRKAMQEHAGNVSAAARALGISRTTLYSRLKLDKQGY